MNENRRQILQMLSEGKINADEAERKRHDVKQFVYRIQESPTVQQQK